MKSLISIFDPTTNFWDVNPKFKVLDVYKEMYKADKSKKKAKSSVDMWMICSFFEPDSPYSSMDEDPENRNGQCRVMSRDICNDENWWYENEERLKEAKDRYEFFTDTPATRSLRNWETKLKQRDQVLAETEYQVGMTNEKGVLVGSNVTVLDKMLVDTGKVWDQFFKIQEALDAEKSSGGVKGDGQESLSDTGEI